MGRLIKSFGADCFLEYDTGAFDDWCVFLTRPGMRRAAVTDLELFSELHVYGSLYGNLKLYRDFVTVYDRTNAGVDKAIIDLIAAASRSYADNAGDVDRLLTCLYAGMVAEENKDRAVLKKRIKRLGVHQVLIEDRTPHFAANFSRGRKAEELQRHCEARGF